jgi:hypothetical protein
MHAARAINTVAPRCSNGRRTFAGGRFAVWPGQTSLQAELTIYGSGVPIVSSEREALTPNAP